MMYRLVSKGRPSVSLFLFLASLLFFLPACHQQEEAKTANTSDIRDDLGILVPGDPLPHHIVSLAPSITETLFALGLDSAVAGVTEYCDYPSAARTKVSVGGMTSPSFERIADLNPDLVLMSVAGNSRADHDKLRNLGFRVFVTNPADLEGLYRSIRNIGILTGQRSKADSLNAQLRREQKRLTQTARQRPAKNVLMLLSLRPVIAVGSGTFLHELLSIANARNLAKDAATSYPMLSREHILALQPDVLLLMSDVAQSPQDVRESFPEWESLDAVRNNRVAILDADLVSRPGPRIMEGLEQIVAALR